MAGLVNAAGSGPGRRPARSAPGRTGADEAGEGLRVLVVDDEPMVGRAIAHAADACGCTVSLAISADSFRSAYDREEPDVVLLDLSLPGGDGVALLRLLAERQSNALILIVSGFDLRVVEAAMRLGVALGLRMGGCLTKPITVRQLADALAAAPAIAARKGGGHALCHG